MKRSKLSSRCPWARGEAYEQYHDTEWGVPVHDDRLLFEFLILEGAQAGLSWITILNKRETYREAFDQFDPEKIARYTKRKEASLLKNPGIVRNRLKVSATIGNAQAYLQLLEEGTTLDAFLWEFVDGKVIQNRWQTMEEVPASTPESDALSKALKKRGFRFIGTTICYAFMQAVGMVNDHLESCFRHQELAGKKRKKKATSGG